MIRLMWQAKESWTALVSEWVSEWVELSWLEWELPKCWIEAAVGGSDSGEWRSTYETGEHLCRVVLLPWITATHIPSRLIYIDLDWIYGRTSFLLDVFVYNHLTRYCISTVYMINLVHIRSELMFRKKEEEEEKKDCIDTVFLRIITMGW